MAPYSQLTDPPPVTPYRSIAGSCREQLADDGGAPHQFAGKDRELRLATSPAPSGPHRTRLARCRGCPGSSEKATCAREHTPSPHSSQEERRTSWRTN